MNYYTAHTAMLVITYTRPNLNYTMLVFILMLSYQHYMQILPQSGMLTPAVLTRPRCLDTLKPGPANERRSCRRPRSLLHTNLDCYTTLT